MRWTEHVMHMGKMRNACRILFGIPERKRPLRGRRHTWEDNIKMHVTEIGYEDVVWIKLALNGSSE
jgi:hypothetical protein